jgi:hypothetical protein
MANEIGRADPPKILPLRPPHPGVFHHKSLFLSYGVFDENYKICADAKFLIQLFFNKEPAVRIPKVITKMSLGGVSSRIGLTLIKENKMLLDELAIPYSKYKWYKIFLKSHFKVVLLRLLGAKRAHQFIDFVRKLQRKPTCKR